MKKNVLILGDVLLDIYHIGKVDRISPESPIPVFLEEKVEYKAGGAANLAKNLAGLGCDVHLMIPKIYPSDELDHFVQVMDNEEPYVGFIFGIDCGNLIWKRRFIDRRNFHQIGLRHDNDLLVKKSELMLTDLSKLDQILTEWKIDAVIFSDYCKGALKNKDFVIGAIQLCKKYKIDSFLDTRSKDIWIYEGIKYFKPNMKEFDLYNEQRVEGVCFEHVLRTESENGMTYISRNSQCSPNEWVHIDSVANNIVDPTGAGDTALAGFVFGIIHQSETIFSMKLANNLAAIACRNRGTYVVNREDLLHAIHQAKLQKPYEGGIREDEI